MIGPAASAPLSTLHLLPTDSPMILTIARITFLEAVRQPIFFIITALSGVAMFFTTWGTGFSMGYTEAGEVSGDNKLLLDLGLASIFLAGTLLAGFLATATMAREIENKTVLTVVSKPVPRPAVVIGKYLGVTTAVLASVVIMIAYLTLAIRHGVLSNASQDIDGPVIVLSLAAGVTAMFMGVWTNFFYGWSFSQVATLSMVPLMVLAAVLATLFGPQWNFMSEGRNDSPVVPMFLSQFKPGVLVASLSLACAIAVLCAIAVAASTRLGQVMTLLICFGVLVLGMLTGPLVGRYAFTNTALGTVQKAEPANVGMEEFARVGDKYVITLRSAPAKVVKPGDPLWYGAFPSGFDLASTNFRLPEGVVQLPFTKVPLDQKPALVVVETDPKAARIVIEQVSGSTTPLNIDRPPRDGDHIFLSPTQTHPVAAIAAAVLPNFQHFWLLDAVSQNQPIPAGHALLILLYSGLLIAAALLAATYMFQSRDVG